MVYFVSNLYVHEFDIPGLNSSTLENNRSLALECTNKHSVVSKQELVKKKPSRCEDDSTEHVQHDTHTSLSLPSGAKERENLSDDVLFDVMFHNLVI